VAVHADPESQQKNSWFQNLRKLVP
jgi:hypothetical protein